ncbi:hypothetical protein DLAC_04530 [Tieghemostelium lacteum]|uniref:ADF-H domain-containing protein n=1 Tax=Tieghemostelium lacteum TaxID=361077 RepID=A0A151ZJW0_TIELA|nr:hypothetical protein DLAC_04530 [Tieghemostelium lacteum]|eukprot:KYQ94236.1 hypothetical protein DLAC_04530 [Tieghemostelium lacteum]
MVSVANREEINKQLTHFRRADNEDEFIIIGYKDANTLQYKTSGKGVKNLVATLQDNEFCYVLIRLQYTEGDVGFKEGVIGGKANFRDVFMTYIGKSVGIIEKGKKNSHIGDAKALLQPFHAELTAINKANITEASIKDRANPLSGSHVID